jgi:putative membrane protein
MEESDMSSLVATHPFVVAVIPELGALLSALLYSVIGIGLFGLAFFIIVKVAPFSMRKEIEEDQNTALGVIIGAVFIGIALIISSAIQG